MTKVIFYSSLPATTGAGQVQAIPTVECQPTEHERKNGMKLEVTTGLEPVQNGFASRLWRFLGRLASRQFHEQAPLIAEECPTQVESVEFPNANRFLPPFDAREATMKPGRP